MYKGKEVIVKLSKEANEVYEELNRIVGEERMKGDADNVWRIELADRWRLVYTITGNLLEIITFVMNIFDHRKYDKVFGYKQ